MDESKIYQTQHHDWRMGKTDEISLCVLKPWTEERRTGKYTQKSYKELYRSSVPKLQKGMNYAELCFEQKHNPFNRKTTAAQ